MIIYASDIQALTSYYITSIVLFYKFENHMRFINNFNPHLVQESGSDFLIEI